MISISLKDFPDFYIDYRKGLNFLSLLNDDAYSYPDGITNFHVYTEFRNPKELLVLKSYLATQNLEKTKLIIWSDYDISDHPGLQPYKHLNCLDFRIYNPVEEAKGTPVEGVSHLLEHDTKYYLRSDLLRLLAGYKYGGIWVDLDIVFLRDFKPILDQEYMYQWGSETNFAVEGACATVLSLFKKSEFAEELLREVVTMPVIPDSTIWGKDMFAKLWRRYPNFTIFPCSFFNTEWLISKVSPEERDKVKRGWFEEKLEDPSHLFLDAFAWHWHNSSNKNKNVVEGSKFDLLDKLTDKKLRELTIL